MIKKNFMKRYCCCDAFNNKFIKRSIHTLNSFSSISSMSNHFTYHTVIIRSNFVTLEYSTIYSSSKTNSLKLNIGEEVKFQNLLIKSLKCKNSEFDDNPEITAYIQVQDLTNRDNNEVFVFNGWTFSSSPAINPFDHPVYDIWLTKCY